MAQFKKTVDKTMKVLFVSAVTEEIAMPTPPLGLAWVAAATREAGHMVEMLDLNANTFQFLIR